MRSTDPCDAYLLLLQVNGLKSAGAIYWVSDFTGTSTESAALGESLEDRTGSEDEEQEDLSLIHI